MRQTDKEYGQALFMLCAEEDICSECLQDVCTVEEVFRENPEYTEFLASPAISLAERLSALDEAFSGRVHEYILYFIKLLCEKGRIRLLFESFEEFRLLCKAVSGTLAVSVTSATELTDEQKQKLCEKIAKTENKKVEATYTVDPSLLGGMKVEYDGKIYDGSVKTRLRSIKDVMLCEQT